MFYKTQKELDVMANSIITIHHRLIGVMKDLAPRERYSSWKEAVKAISEELESVHGIVNMMDVMPCTLIGVDKYIHLTENISSPDCPFPSWKKALKPDEADIAGHPWLLIVKCCFNLQYLTPMTAATPAASIEATPLPTAGNKGKGKEIDGLVALVGIRHVGRNANVEDGESEIDMTDQLIDDEDDEPNPPQGYSTTQCTRSTS
ncbi:hypothetical protein EDC04DRAFT_2611117 [Pisolithus marmoratus]|nr:hypothetical protein EDC04DRAFT_2611117 [Pisolithus marmoratus]